MRHIEARRLFVVFDQFAVFEKDVAFVPTIVIAEYRHQSRTSRGLVSGLNGGERTWQIRIAVQNKKPVTEQCQGLFESPARTQQFIAVERVIDRKAESVSIAYGRLYLVTEMTDAQHHPIDALAL